MPKITEVHFERIFNIGNYENIKIGLKGIPGPTETPEEAILELDKEITSMFNETGHKRRT